ncbi:MAG TPA: tripartite tricarboxylate transporter substrate binding protein [Burkholderiales bacterium]|nr:tripartite tricarboxylate transporter substrate binding protein [Burkholderiales bacterium]
MPRLRLIGAWLLAAAPLLAAAQGYPAKPVKLVVPWPAGGTVDGVARVVSPRLAERLGQPVIIENRPGAGGSVGAASVAKSPPDGLTLLMVFDTHAVNHHLYRNAGYDGFKAFEHISRLVGSPQILVAALNFPPSTLNDLIAYAKANPGKVTYGSVGTGSSNHLNALFLSSRTGVQMVHVPYKGGAPMMQDLVGGQLNTMFVSAPQAIPQVKAGRIKALASGSAKRIPQLPDTPTVDESLPGFEAASWVGVVAPGGTPKEIVARLHREFTGVLEDGDVRGKLVAQGFEIVGSSPGEFLRFVAAESDKWAKVIREYDIRVE